MKLWRIQSTRKAFTLAETIVASVILCAAVVTICAITARGLSAVKLNKQYELAWQLLDRQLTLIDYTGIESFIELGETEGEFEEIEPKYRWRVETTAEDYDNLYRVSITISWQDRNHVRSIAAETMFNGLGSAVVAAQ